MLFGAVLPLYMLFPTQQRLAQWLMIFEIGTMIFVLLPLYISTLIPSKSIRELSDALRSLSLRDYDKRLPLERFGRLRDVARAYNEAAATLADNNASLPNIWSSQSGEHPHTNQSEHTNEHASYVSNYVDSPTEISEPTLPPNTKVKRSVDEDTKSKAACKNYEAQNFQDKSWTSGILSDDQKLYTTFIAARSELRPDRKLPSRDTFFSLLQKERSRVEQESPCDRVDFELRHRKGDVALQPHAINFQEQPL